MTQRIFLAIPVSTEVQRQIASWRASREDLRELPLRWLDDRDLHVTLVPPWNEDRIEDLLDRFKSFAPTAMQKPIRFDRIHYGPMRDRPRLVWAIAKTAGDLIRLKHQIERALDLRRDPRPLKAHLTLARFEPQAFAQFPVQDLNDFVSWIQSVNRVAVYESIVAPDGVHYNILAEKELAPPSLDLSFLKNDLPQDKEI